MKTENLEKTTSPKITKFGQNIQQMVLHTVSGADFQFLRLMILFFKKQCFSDSTPWNKFFENFAPLMVSLPIFFKSSEKLIVTLRAIHHIFPFFFLFITPEMPLPPPPPPVPPSQKVFQEIACVYICHYHISYTCLFMEYI